MSRTGERHAPMYFREKRSQRRKAETVCRGLRQR